MTRSMGKLLHRSRNFLGRMLRKPAWDFQRFVEESPAAAGAAVAVPDLDVHPVVGLSDEPGELAPGRDHERICRFGAAPRQHALRFRGQVCPGVGCGAADPTACASAQ